MPWPLSFAGLSIPGTRALAFVIAADLAAGGGTVVEDVPTVAWVADIARQLMPAERDALLHTLLAFPERRAIGLGVELALMWSEQRALPTLIAALHTHDTGLLLSPDRERRTIEASLARAVALLGPIPGVEDRTRVLQVLRGADLPELEATVLITSATADELRIWGEDLLVDDRPAVRDILARGREREAIAATVATLLR